MYYVVGLGNPGREYTDTRHNVGFAVASAFADSSGFSSLHESKTHGGRIAQGVVGGEEVTVLLPSTFMNASGKAVKKLVPPEELSRLIVVYDDIDLPLGELKISFGRGNGGHNGVRSITESMGSPDFVRLRIGIAQKSIWTGKLKRPKGDALSLFVLGAFTAKERKVMAEVVSKAQEALGVCITEGKQKAMNMYN